MRSRVVLSVVSALVGAGLCLGVVRLLPSPATSVEHSPLAAGASKVVSANITMELPGSRPPELALVAAPALSAERAEVLFQVGVHGVMVCQAADIDETSCAVDGARVIRERQPGDGNTWRVVLMPQDLQKGPSSRADEAAVVAWWETATYTDETPAWMVDLDAANSAQTDKADRAKGEA